MIAFVDALDLVKDHILLSTDSTLAPQVFDPRVNPAPNMADGLSFAIGATSNTGNYRDRGEVRVEHTVTVGFAQQLVMADQYTSTKDALEREERIIAASGQADHTERVRLAYRSTRRALSPSREWLIVEIEFSVIHDHIRGA